MVNIGAFTATMRFDNSSDRDKMVILLHLQNSDKSKYIIYDRLIVFYDETAYNTAMLIK